MKNLLRNLSSDQLVAPVVSMCFVFMAAISFLVITKI